LPQVAPERRVVSERALSAEVGLERLLALRLRALLLDPVELGLQPADRVLAGGLVALSLDGVVADDEALGCVPLADANLLDRQVVSDGLVAALRASAAAASGEPSRIRSPAIQWPPARVEVGNVTRSV